MEKNLYVFTYREEFTADILAVSETEARKLLVEDNNWKMLGEPHPDYLIMEVNPDEDEN